MKQILIALLFAIPLVCNADLVVSEKFHALENDVRAQVEIENNPILDERGQKTKFALLIVRTTATDLVFDNKVYVLRQEFKDNEWWVALKAGAKNLTIKSKNNVPLDIKFEAVVNNATYMMTIADEGSMGNIVINSNVGKDAKIYIDGAKVSDGAPFIYKGVAGKHELKIEATGYSSQIRDVDIRQGQMDVVTVNLFTEGTDDGLVKVKDGVTFEMGSDRFYYENPKRTINLMPFSIGSMLVTYDTWKNVVGEDDRKKGPNGEVINVSYDEVQFFLSSYSEMKGETYRLPSEAEWEYCAKNAKTIGIEDINKGQLEWCSDWFGKYDLTKPNGPDEGVVKVVRGGSLYGNSNFYSQPTYRWHQDPSKGSEKISFRIVKDE